MPEEKRRDSISKRRGKKGQGLESLSEEEVGQG